MVKTKFQENIPLAEYTTFKIGGPAKYFLVAKTTDDLIEAVDFTKSKNLPYFILGGGSNLLISDKGFDGLVIKIPNSKFKIQNSKIIAEAGVPLGKLVKCSIDAGLTGLEWAVGIPGTVGGAVKVNAACFGGNMKDLVKKVKKIDDIIISVELKLKKGNQEKSKRIIKEFIKKRKQTQPIEYPSAGCIFKNPPGQFAGQLIEQSGLKGKQIGQAMVSEKHANFIINLGGAKANDVLKLINLIKKSVKDKFNLDLEEEIVKI
jgi:UDP-N-acetylmuramate dehydrogenase